ncbi:MAG: hypothetical protein A3F82_02625 [Deltaproteobacteria bacterium RIFCSPLOWO2_12_FULL_44_12]|nr:MAG: hypothetical protein A2712_10770 [Deltaproteobacteria bacterium RIFCSPHIGHO2_01_FULL_43_49]OGQ16536.1 MAG: hypothetical protein A3D22_06470 [Deltaproteobacteria bacterium RIFCSPHIGHO2_02_FULL_44_53]OGQ28353.1 MAG: hypothetical protein A3D98_06175 [Deltaproteobacteria bacterium RIFCSPHIGHO2_12_FULL_44_21]OGQ32424.1 MAG: hypothetical protein A2979_10735 [Deltaproteobacteria bacterium RIFCSPLOWO2_01_FULL_45_74]OGQ41549.1 MAG: hypothetical protein A3I70_05080 [Deltaproteobacteria bacterium 
MAKKKGEFHEEETESKLDLEGLDEPKGESLDLGDFGDEAVSMSEDVPVRLVAVLGQKKMVLKDLLKLKVGHAIDFERAPNEFVDLMANGKLVARGELVEIDGKLGVRIIKLLK